ncbi:MAG TPA: GAF domain-containing protein, partial [bacterium]|nr:GAF domain-containing protein [bacterium]
MKKNPIKVVLVSQPNQQAEAVAKRLSGSRSPRFEVEMKAPITDVTEQVSGESNITLLPQQESVQGTRDDRERLISTLAAVAGITTKASTPTQLCEDLAKTLRATFACDAFFVLRYDSESGELVDVCKGDTIGGTFQIVPNASDSSPLTGILATAVEQRRTLRLLRDSPQSPEKGFVAFGDTERLSLSLLVCPMIAEDRLLGLLSVQSYTPNAYTESDEDLLFAVGQQVGPALVAALLNQEIRKSHASQSLFSKQLSTLLEVTNQLSTAGSFDVLCRRAVELGRERLKFDRLGLWFFDQERRSVRGSFGIDETGCIRDERDQETAILSGTSMSRMLSGQIRFLMEEDSDLRDHTGAVVGHGDYSVACISDGRKVIGCICHDNLLGRTPISDHDNELLQLYASALGALCSLKKSEEQLRESHAELEQRVQERTERLQKTNEDLQFEIDERKRTEQMLRDSERRYRTL